MGQFLARGPDRDRQQAISGGTGKRYPTVARQLPGKQGDQRHVDAIQVNDDECIVEVIDLETCIECHSCQQNCPQEAIFVYPQLEDAMAGMK